MSNVFHISDLHFYHKKIMQFAGDYRDGDTPLENMHIIICLYNSIIKKNDTVFFHGDVVWRKEDLSILDDLKGRKILIAGNHDDHPMSEYVKYFEDVRGLLSYKGFWLSHAPVHPNELRGKRNIHGHVHMESIRNAYHEIDDRYINVCVENTGGVPVSHKSIVDGTFKQVIR